MENKASFFDQTWVVFISFILIFGVEASSVFRNVLRNAAASNAGGPAGWGLGVEVHPHLVRTQFYQNFDTAGT
jgi:hypothetical protein